MDIVEIRKKAKKFKKNKAGASPEEVKEEVKKAKVSKEEPENKVPKKSKSKKAEVKEVAPEAEDSFEEMATVPETLGAETEAEVEGEGADFLTLALNTLVQEGYEEGLAEKTEDEREKIIELLCFRLANEEYAIDIRDLNEIIKVVDITEVPKTPHYILGIISLRGTIMPLFDLRLRLGLETKENDRNTRIIIVSDGDRNIGMVVDRVTEVVRLKEGSLEPPPILLNNVDADLLKGVGRFGERLLVIPNLSKVFDVKL